VRYLVDTNIISEIRKGERCDPQVAHWWAGVDDDDLYLSVLVLGEIRQGIERVRPRDPRKADVLEHWLDRVRGSFGERILPVDDEVAEEWGKMSAKRPLPMIDGLLAATAKARRLTLATRNVADMGDTGAWILNPFEVTE